MAVKKGYKQTEVGVIPDDWLVKRIKSVCKLVNGRGFKPFEWKSTGQPIIRIQNLNGSDEFNYFEGSYDKKLEIAPGQLLFAWSGSRGTSFGPHIWDGPLGLLNYHTWKVDVKEDQVNKEFFLYALRQLTSFIEGNAHGASALVHTQKWEMEGFEFPLPPTLPEQEAIAGALSDADEWIESLEQLIAKKRQIKQGAMQELLTGKRRLPGFSGQWETKAIKDISWFQEGPGVRNSQFTTSGVKLLNGTNIFRGVLNLDTTTRFISEKEAYGPYAHFLAERGDIVLASSGISVERLHEKVAFVRSENLPFCMNTSTIRFKTNESQMCTSYLFHYLTGDDFKSQISGQATGSAQLNFGPSHVAKVTLECPSLPEQTAIATVLSDMDTEIKSLEAKRAKAREIKQGMMQELLTGRIRLV